MQPTPLGGCLLTGAWTLNGTIANIVGGLDVAHKHPLTKCLGWILDAVLLCDHTEFGELRRSRGPVWLGGKVSRTLHSINRMI